MSPAKTQAVGFATFSFCLLALVPVSLSMVGCVAEAPEEEVTPDPVPEPVDQVCSNGRYMRQGVDQTLVALKTLRDGLATGKLTSGLRDELCASLTSQLNSTAKSWASARGNARLQHPYFDKYFFSEMSRSGYASKLLSSDLFFYDSKAYYYHADSFYPGKTYSNTQGPWKGGLAAAYLENAIGKRLEYTEEECVPGTVWQDQPDGSRILVDDPCATKQTVSHIRDGHDEATNALGNMTSLGARLGLVCGSLRYQWEEWSATKLEDGLYKLYDMGAYVGIDNGYDTAPLDVAAPEFATAIDESISLIEADLATNGTSAYQAMGCKAEEAFVAP